MSHVIHVEHLSKAYGSHLAVDDISFSVNKGEIFGIVGPNGAGKTTTLNLLTGLRTPDSGSVHVLNLDPQKQGHALRQRIGIQLQEADLPDRIKVWEALDLFSSFYRHSVDWEPLLEEWGLAEKRNAAFGSLSGGQKQRVFIALSLVNDPEIVFLDELTTGLDPHARRRTWDMVRAVRDRGKTVIQVTHFMDEAEVLCDRVAVVDKSRLIALDTPGKLIDSYSCESRVHFTARNDFDLDPLLSIPGASHAEQEKERVTVYGEGPLLVRVATVLGELGIEPRDLTFKRPTLEDAFLRLTGSQ